MRGDQKPILVLLQCLLLALYLILLSVLYLIQFGKALFDLIMTAIFFFLAKDLIDPISLFYSSILYKIIKMFNQLELNAIEI